MKLSLAITTHNRFELTIESFSKVIGHPMLDEILIVDDFSDLEIFNKLYSITAGMPNVKLNRNEKNLGMSLNKREAISKAKNEWTIIFDSDNVLYPEYIDAASKLMPSHKNCIFCPVFAEPDFNFSEFSGMVIDRNNAKDYLHKKEFRVFLNTSNYLVNKNEYLRVYRHNPEIKESDTIWFNWLWLDAGNCFYFVPGMVYYHRKHEGSGWLRGDHEYNLRKAREIQELIKLM